MCRITSSEQYDILFKENDKLKWYPFVGKQYANSNVKVLIIGESHYASENKNVGWDSIEYLEKSKEYEDKIVLDIQFMNLKIHMNGKTQLIIK